MKCPHCDREDPQGREMCPHCGAPILPLPVPPGGRVNFGAYDWYVLDKQDDRAFIVTEKVINTRAYHSREEDVTWETCDMRQYLNGDFYHSFGAADRAQIIEVVNCTSDNPWYGTSGGQPTDDKIFLLSIEEVINYFGDSGQLATRYMYPGCDWCNDEYLPWIDDQYNIARRAVDEEGIVRHWRLRSPGATRRRVASVMGFCGDGFDNGCLDIAGGGEMTDGYFMFDGSGYLSNGPRDELRINGVRPALWLRMPSA